MTLTLNRESVQTGAYPATVTMFQDGGSLCHLFLGFICGSEIVTPKVAVMLLAAFTGYQVSQAQAGDPWSRTGGELLEFALGMLGGMTVRSWPEVLA